MRPFWLADRACEPSGSRSPGVGLDGRCHRCRRTRGRVRAYFFLPLVDSFTVVFGLLLTVDCLTNRPLTALRPRLPLPPLVLFLPAMLAS